MAYLSKETLLAAYKKLSNLSENPSVQGATQRVSAIRYILALDMFYKKNNRECNTRETADKAEFVKYVNSIVAIDDTLYTTNFYYPLSVHQGDCSVGSNFYSVGAVRESLANASMVIQYPRRGSASLFEIKNGVLFERYDLIANIHTYIPTDELKFALALWMLRRVELPFDDIIIDINNCYSEFFTSNFASLITPHTVDFPISFDSTPARISADDIYALFENKKGNTIILDFPRQLIYFGAPGTGKSYAVKSVTEPYENTDNVFRTTFHPDSDYSTFVGSYKPTKEKRPVRNVAGDIVKQNGQEVFEETITYNFIPQAFTKAYIRAWQTDQPVFLVIEEINRGNCAQIFGDLFQLLDRKNNISEYPIKPDHDLGTYINEQFRKHGCVAPDDSAIFKGEELCLPANLYIWATMNTSDQSLFPIDSAFKRRWEWRYIKIAKPIDKETGRPFDWHIEGDTDWWQFLKKINAIISKMTNSADKQLGYFFAKADDAGEIKYDRFVAKVCFYLWNDIFKTYAMDDVETDLFKFKYTDENGQEKVGKLNFTEFFDENGKVVSGIVQQFIENVMKWNENTKQE